MIFRGAQAVERCHQRNRSVLPARSRVFLSSLTILAYSAAILGAQVTEQQLRARRSRSIAIALALGAFVVVIFLVTLVKLGSNVLTRPM